MARISRIVLPGHPHHITQRGNRRQTVFFSEQDYRYYLELISESCADCGTECWAYCLMPNHVHHIMIPRHVEGLRDALSEAHRKYARSINKREGWRGHLWQERFYSVPMDEPHLLRAVRYVEQNPVAAGLVRHADEWPWSSARAHLRAKDDRLVAVRPMMERVYDWSTYLSTCDDEESIESLRKYTRTGRPAGSENYIELVEKIVGKSLRHQKPGRKPVANEGVRN